MRLCRSRSPLAGRLSRTVTLWDGSAAQQAARLAPQGVTVVAGFHALSAEALGRLDEPVDSDTLICGDSAEAKAVVQEIAAMIPGVNAIDAGALDMARLLENAAALLISLNLRYKVKHSGNAHHRARNRGRPPMKARPIVALAGGVGAARFLDGLARVLPPERLFIIGNTGDDAEIHGLHISPDLDTVTYNPGRPGRSAAGLGHSRRPLPVPGGSRAARRRDLVFNWETETWRPISIARNA